MVEKHIPKDLPVLQLLGLRTTYQHVDQGRMTYQLGQIRWASLNVWGTPYYLRGNDESHYALYERATGKIIGS